jgi:uncharacterized RmlC-like cupin family protein
MVQQFAGVKVIKSGDVVIDPVSGIGWAISAGTAGSKTLVFGTAKVPPGAMIPAHYHTCETAALLVRGRAAIRTGEKLDERLEMAGGDYIYVGANVIHDEETLGDEVAEFIMARDEQGGETIPVDPSDPGWAHRFNPATDD